MVEHRSNVVLNLLLDKTLDIINAELGSHIADLIAHRNVLARFPTLSHVYEDWKQVDHSVGIQNKLLRHKRLLFDKRYRIISIVGIQLNLSSDGN